MATATTPDKKTQAFFNYIRDDNAATVRRVLARGMSPEATDEQGRPALHCAAMFGCTGSIKELLDAGARVNLRTTANAHAKDVTALNAAIHNYQLRAAEMLLAHGADPRITGRENHPAAYHLLARLEHIVDPVRAPRYTYDDALPVFVTMLEKGVRLDQAQTLMAAALTRHVPVGFVEALLKHGVAADLIKGFEGPGRDWRDFDFDNLRLLTDNGADINALGTQGKSVLRAAYDVAVVDELIRLGTDINHLDNNGQNALASMFDEGVPKAEWLPKMARLVELDVDLDHRDYAGESVMSRLAGMHDPVSTQLKALIGAHRARSIMTAARRHASTTCGKS